MLKLPCLVLGIVALSPQANVASQELAPTISGAVADTPPQTFRLSNGVHVTVFESARNELYKRSTLDASA